jgi:N-acetyl-gamma-glutamyl-phosphate reductase
MQSAENVKKDIKVGVVGGGGYAGLELTSLLLSHPRVYLRACFSARENFTFADYLPHRATHEIPVVPLDGIDEWLPELDTVFLATPSEASLTLAPKILDAGVNVIDLSGAFRLTQGSVETQKDVYQTWYGLEHSQMDLLQKAEYGLMPWGQPKRENLTTGARLIANPGCYATAILMAILPLVKRGLIDLTSLVVDCKSGTSGAGRTLVENLLFTEVEGECMPYKIGRHQHLPEICQYTEAFSGFKIAPHLTTHLINTRRGILSSIYAKTPPGVTAQDLSVAYTCDYSDYDLVHWGSLSGLSARASTHSLSLKRVVGTAYTGIYFELVPTETGGQLYLFSLIDNLIKGAAGQAIENFNQLHDFSASYGLTDLRGVL